VRTPRWISSTCHRVTDEEFWAQAEGRVIEALRSYSAGATNGESYQRKLFADDAAQGFAFVDNCRKRFDVVLMNPPFGDASKPSKAYIEKNYPRTKNDVYAAFVERGLGWLYPGGLLGAITSRTGFFLSSFRKWREEIVLGEARPTVVADLGQGVLDTAMVETAAYALEKSR
jgi:type I restriction-modification system DNA methylase subunit